MSHFYSGIKGNRGEATRRGTKGSGVRGFVSGWNFGATCRMSLVDSKDEASVQFDSGSGYGLKGNYGICAVREDDAIRVTYVSKELLAAIDTYRKQTRKESATG